MLRSQTCLLIACIFYSLSLYAQNDSLRIDSVKKVLLTQKEDTNRINTLNALSNLLGNERDSALHYAKKALMLSQKLNFKNGEGTAYFNYGIALRGRSHTGEQGTLKEVLDYFQNAIRIFRTTGNQSGTADYYYQIALSYQDLDQNIPEGIKNFLSALRLYEKLGNKQQMAKCYMHLGMDYSYETDTREEGLNNLKSALKTFIEVQDSSSSAYTAHLIGDTYLYDNRYNEALEYYNIALRRYKELGTRGPDFGISWTEGSIADVYMSQGNDAIETGDRATASLKLQTALKMFNERLAAERAGNRSHRQTYGQLGDCYFYLSKIATHNDQANYLAQSQKYYQLGLGLAVKANHKPFLSHYYYKLSEVSSALGSYKKALEYYKNAIIYGDSVENEENTKQIVQAKMQYEFDKKEAIAKAEQEKKDADTKRIKNQQYFTIAALAIIMMAASLIALIQWRNSKQKQKANSLLKEEKEKVETTLSQLKTTQAQLIQSEKMASLGELTAGIAHEIQNPLNFVNNFSEVSTELIEELKQENHVGKPDEVAAIAGEITANLQKINHHGKRAESIVKGMLQHARTGTGKKEFINLNALADEYLRLSYHGFRAKDKTFNATIKIHFDDGVGKINIAPQDIGRVLLNLFNNAFYAVHEKSKNADDNYEPTVTVSTRKHNNEVEITISDNGMGISKSVQDKIFQPFFTTKPTGQGTGLGLSLSYDIVKAHGGTLKVESKEEEGSSFVIQLPENA